jgi:hemerythrin
MTRQGSLSLAVICCFLNKTLTQTNEHGPHCNFRFPARSAVMPFMDWTDTLSVKNETIDADHKRLIDLINKLHDAMMERQGAKIVGGVLIDLIDYTKTHFGREEGLMKGSFYPQYPAHKAEHETFIQQVNELQKKFTGGAISISLKTMDFLRDWLFNHIMKVDQQLGQWMESH